MTIAYWCVVVACFLPWMAISYAKFLSPEAKLRDFDNNAPRDFLDGLEGKRKRAVWAEKNLHESLPLFIACVLIAHQIGANQNIIDVLALSFIGLRIVYIATYIYDQATLRSLVWFAGVLSCLAMVLAGGAI